MTGKHYPMGLKSLRLEKGWSQEQLAAISGLSERTIQRAERGETASLETLRALAASFELSAGQLRDLMQPPRETHDMAANNTTPAPASTPEPVQEPVQEPVLGATAKRLLLGGAIYLGVISWLAFMQAVAGWDPELLPYAALTGAGLLASWVFITLAGKSGDE